MRLGEPPPPSNRLFRRARTRFVLLAIATAGRATAADATAATAPPPTPAVAERIARVENNLLPAARIAGAKADPWTVARRMAALKVPGISIAVINEGAIEWTHGYGVMSAGGTAAVTTDTLFQAASVSKPVAALGALTLVDGGQLTLDADVNEKLKTWKVPAAPAAEGERVTLRRLLSHTAGLTVSGFPGYAAGAPVPTLVQILDGGGPGNTVPIRIDLKPGTRWRYSGGGYCVLQQLMIDVTGETFPALMRERVLRPAGMNASTYEQPLPSSLAGQAATGHDAEGQPVPGQAHVYPEMAAAGLWTTPANLARFAITLPTALKGAGGLVTRSTAEAMITPILPASEYGLGIGTKGEGNALQLSHGGSNQGFRCMLVLYPRTGRGAVIMTNAANGNRLAIEILRSLAQEYDWPDYQMVERTAFPLPPGTFGAYVGRYEREDVTLTFTESDGRYFMLPGSGPRTEIFPQSDSEFFSLTAPDTYAFERNNTGNVTHLIRRTSPPQIFKRITR